MRNIQNQIDTKYSQLNAIYLHVHELLQQGKSVDSWLEMYYRLADELEMLHEGKNQPRVVQIFIEDIYLN